MCGDAIAGWQSHRRLRALGPLGHFGRLACRVTPTIFVRYIVKLRFQFGIQC
jgi:hypothetical protein